ncbi:MAG: STAS domain-containing protein [Myxococcota bacterium]
MLTVTCDAGVVRFEGELDVYAVRDAHVALQPLLEGEGALRADLSKVEALDGAGVQLVVWFRRALGARGRVLTLEGALGPVAAQLDFLRLRGGEPC